MKHWFTQSLRESAWAPASVVVVYAVAAKGFDAYLSWPNLDMPTHFAGGLAITYFFITAIRNLQARIGAVPKLVRLTMAVGLTALSAVLWEFLEFASDRFFGTLMNLGVTDTLSDLFFGIVGALVAAGISARWKTEGPNPIPEQTSDGVTVARVKRLGKADVNL